MKERKTHRDTEKSKEKIHSHSTTNIFIRVIIVETKESEKKTTKEVKVFILYKAYLTSTLVSYPLLSMYQMCVLRM